MSWADLSQWWLEEIENDPAYEEVVTPLLFEMFEPSEGERYLDMGGGEGRVMRDVAAGGAQVVGIDLNEKLAGHAEGIVVAELPSVPFREDSFSGAYSVLTLEHVPDHRGFFAEAARVVRPKGVLAVVINHPVWTAPGSTPISDTNGEVLWRPGEYFSSGTSQVPAGEGTVTFHHRTMAELLQAAADAGWRLTRILEQSHHEIEDQPGIPRLLACGWRLS